MTSPRKPGPGQPNSPRRPSTTPLGTGTPPVATRSLVEQIVAEQKQQKAEVQRAIQGKAVRRIAPIAAGILVVVNVVAWVVFPPATEKTGTRRTPMQAENDLRLYVAAAASEIDIWRSRNGGLLPASLADVGITDTALVFVNVDGVVYELRGTNRGVTLAYRSNVSITDFLDGGVPGRR